MDFKLTDDQDSVVSAIEKIAEQFAHKPTDAHGFVLTGPALEQELIDGEYFDIAMVPEFGPLSAALSVERLARLPYAVEAAYSMLVRPQLLEAVEGEWPRPLAVVENGRPGRFVATAKTVLIIDGDNISIASPTPDEVEAVDTIFAYPMGKLKPGVKSTPIPAEHTANIRKWLRVAMACEAAGLIQAAIDSTVDHLTQRKQFGRPLGTFQALRHRMAECAVLAGGVKWLALKAAGTGDDADAALAAMHAQESATRVTYDVHQMLAAMGMTLEHPLHLWTYRLKALLSDLGGRGGQAAAIAEYCFATDLM